MTCCANAGDDSGESPIRMMLGQVQTRQSADRMMIMRKLTAMGVITGQL
jgi:hypothetical protein